MMRIFRIVIIPTVISLFVSMGMLFLSRWASTFLLLTPDSLDPRQQPRAVDPDYFASIVTRIQEALDTYFLVATLIIFGFTFFWFLICFATKLHGSGISRKSRVAWHILGFAAIACTLGVGAYLTNQGNLMDRVSSSVMIYLMLGTFSLFYFNYWLASFLATDRLYRPAIPFGGLRPW